VCSGLLATGGGLVLRCGGGRRALGVVWAAALLGTSAVLPSGCRRDEKARQHVAVLRSESAANDDRQAAVNSLRIIGRNRRHTAEVVPVLIEALDDRDPMVAKQSAEALKFILRRPDMPDSSTAWKNLWRRIRDDLAREENLSPEERMKREKAKLKSDQGYLHLMRGDFRTAEDLFLEAVALHTDEPMYWNNLGKALARQGRWPDAVDKYLTAIEKDGYFAAAHYNLSEAYLEMSRLSRHDRSYEALDHAEQAVKLDPEKKEWAPRWLKARILLGMAVSAARADERRDIYAEAARAIEEALEIAPEMAQVRKTAALVYYGQELYYRCYRQVKRLYELGYEMDPGFMGKLKEALAREAYKAGTEPPPMPKPERGREGTEGPPPALRMPFGGGEVN
jgi:tetratricopeptide (TPR) repeat protein